MGEFFQWSCARSNEEMLAMLKNGKEAIKFLPSASEKGTRIIEEICMSLEGNIACRALSLARNSITTKEAQTISDMLIANHNLVYLNLSYNLIGDDGAKAIADALQRNTTLTYLSLAFNKFGDKGGASFVTALQNNFSLLTLKISTAFCKESTVEDIKKHLNRNRQLTKRNIKDSDGIPTRYSNVNVLPKGKKRNKKSVISHKSWKRSTGHSSTNSIASSVSSLNPLYKGEEEI